MDTLPQHYARMLGLDDAWRVESAELDLAAQRLTLRLAHAGGRAACPACGAACGLADHAPERRWRHLDAMPFATELVARLPRTRCPQHGVKTVVPPWAGKPAHFTLLFEAFAVAVLQASASVEAAAALLRMSWDQTQALMGPDAGAHGPRRGARPGAPRGLARRAAAPIKHLGLDEKSFGKGHDDVTVLTDLEGGRALEVVPERTIEAAETVLDCLSDTQRQGVAAVAADMLPAYAAAVQSKLPQAELVHDKFHVAKHLGEAVDQVRRGEHKALAGAGDQCLKGTRHLWLPARTNLRRADRRRLEALRRAGLKTARAWALKEEFRWFWRGRNAGAAAAFFRRWHGWAVRSRLPAMKRKAAMLRRRLPGLLAYARHRITNAAAEGFNSAIQALRHAARGFRNFANCRTRILFCCGRLDLKP